MSLTRERTPRGFTLLEMLVVLAVIGLLAGLVAPLVIRNVGDARQQTARTQIEMFGLALDAYRLDVGQYPSSELGLGALWRRPDGLTRPDAWRGPYVRKVIEPDPWDRPYVYTVPGDSSGIGYDLWTLGRDGVWGGAGEGADVVSWRAGSS